MPVRTLLFGLLFTMLLLLPRTAVACPMCSEAVPDTSGAEAIDAERESQGYNRSIYLMAGMPYLLLGGMGLLIYRGYRRQAQGPAQQVALAGAATGGNGHVCASLPANPSESLTPDRSAGQSR
jgi:hypothetical protein